MTLADETRKTCAGSEAVAHKGSLVSACRATHPQIEAVRELLDADADVNECNELRRTALHFAARRGCVEIVELLIERGADVAAADGDKGVTPLMNAVYSDSIECVKAILKAEPDLFEVHTGQERRDGVPTLFELARQFASDQMLQFLETQANTRMRWLRDAVTKREEQAAKTQAQLLAAELSVERFAECVQRTGKADLEAAMRHARERSQWKYDYSDLEREHTCLKQFCSRLEAEGVAKDDALISTRSKASQLQKDLQDKDAALREASSRLSELVSPMRSDCALLRSMQRKSDMMIVSLQQRLETTQSTRQEKDVMILSLQQRLEISEQQRHASDSVLLCMQQRLESGEQYVRGSDCSLESAEPLRHKSASSEASILPPRALPKASAPPAKTPRRKYATSKPRARTARKRTECSEMNARRDIQTLQGSLQRDRVNELIDLTVASERRRAAIVRDYEESATRNDAKAAHMKGLAEFVRDNMESVAAHIEALESSDTCVDDDIHRIRAMHMMSRWTANTLGGLPEDS